MYLEILGSVDDVLKDVRQNIYKEGKDEIRYELPNDNVLVIQVLASNGDKMEISVERLDEFGNTIEAAQDDYEVEDKVLIAMIENAMML